MQTCLYAWNEQVQEQLPAYLGHVFEDIAAQAYTRNRARLKLPMVHEWGCWEGVDRDRQPAEIDVVAWSHV